MCVRSCNRSNSCNNNHIIIIKQLNTFVDTNIFCVNISLISHFVNLKYYFDIYKLYLKRQSQSSPGLESICSTIGLLIICCIISGFCIICYNKAQVNLLKSLDVNEHMQVYLLSIDLYDIILYITCCIWLISGMPPIPPKPPNPPIPGIPINSIIYR